MHLWNRAIVVGLPGVGKTSLCQTANPSLGYNYVNYGELMLNISQKHSLATSLDEMLQLDIDLQYQIWKSAALKVDPQENILLDLHGVDLTDDGYLISLPFEIIPPEIIILIEAPYEDMLKRRIADKSKSRRLQYKEAIRENLSILKNAMITICSLLGSNLVILQNNDFDKCLEDLKTVLIREP